MDNKYQELIQVADLCQSILDDIFKDFTHPRKRWVRPFLKPLVWFSAHRFAGLAANLDNTITLHGFRRALQEFVVPFVSGVLAPIFLHNPLIRLWSGVRDPLMIAEATQVITQMILKKRFRMTPKITFDIPQRLDDLRGEYESAYHSILTRASTLMMGHLPKTESSFEKLLINNKII